jgi:hypothetical protein
MLLDFTPFYTQKKTERSILKNVPMGYLKLVLKKLNHPDFNIQGRKFRILYRGPRRTDPRDLRSNYSKRSNCLKGCANRFSVYLDTRKVR